MNKRSLVGSESESRPIGKRTERRRVGSKQTFMYYGKIIGRKIVRPQNKEMGESLGGLA